MSALIEAISVVIRKATIEQKYGGGLAQYRRDCPNMAFCADEHLTRVGFVAPPDVQRYVTGLEQQGFVFFNFVPNEDISDRMQFLRHENGLDVPLDRETSETVYVGRLEDNPGKTDIH